MRKLFLLILSIYMISAVSAEDYFVVIDGYSQDELQKVLNSVKWDIYTPNISKVVGNTIYFESEKDYARFLLPVKLVSPNPVSPLFSNITGSKKALVIVGGLDSGMYGGTSTIYVDINASKLVKGYAFLLRTQLVSDTDISEDDTTQGGVYDILSRHISIGLRDYSYEGGTTSAAGVVLFGDNIRYSTRYPSRFLVYTVECAPRSILEIYSLPNANIYIDNSLIGTTDNGGYLKAQVPCGEHTLKVTKDGFWDYTKTINIQNDTTLHISLAPKTSIFRVEKNMTSDLYPNSIGDVKLHLEPIRTAYGTQMTISGVNVVKVYYKNSLLAPSDGAYVLGTVDGPVDVEIQFKTPSSWGEHSFAVTISASDIEGNSYTNQEQITYDVKELPFLLQTPNTWKIGENTVTITDQSGEDYSVLLSLKTLDGKEIWSQSQGFNAYDSYDFTIPINQSGDYVLEILAKGGQVKTYVPVHVIDPIHLLTPDVNATKGGVATIKLEIQNPSSSVKYFDATVMGEIFDVNDTPKQTFSISPGETKTVELKFQVPENLTYDSYNLNVEVFEKDNAEPIFSDAVVLNLKEGGLILPAVAGNDTLLYLIGAAGLILLLGVGAYSYRVRT